MSGSAGKLGSIMIAVATVAAPALVALPASPASAAAPRITVTVPNNFVRTCSRITSRCTAYRQTNPPYNPWVPSVYSTKWVWYWI